MRLTLHDSPTWQRTGLGHKVNHRVNMFQPVHAQDELSM